jgi:hypothetical protein
MSTLDDDVKRLWAPVIPIREKMIVELCLLLDIDPPEAGDLLYKVYEKFEAALKKVSELKKKEKEYEALIVLGKVTYD